MHHEKSLSSMFFSSLRSAREKLKRSRIIHHHLLWYSSEYACALEGVFPTVYTMCGDRFCMLFVSVHVRISFISFSSFPSFECTFISLSHITYVLLRSRQIAGRLIRSHHVPHILTKSHASSQRGKVNFPSHSFSPCRVMTSKPTTRRFHWREWPVD